MMVPQAVALLFLNFSCFRNSSQPATLERMLQPTVGEPTAMALDLNTSVMTSFLSDLAILKTLTTVSGLWAWISEAILWAMDSVPFHMVS